MRQVFDNLRNVEYVNAHSVEALRKYIRDRNPGISGEEYSTLFADALHSIIDTRIYQFEKEHRERIRYSVLKRAVKKEEFSINAAEIFCSCLTLKMHGDSYVNSLTQWINDNQPIIVRPERVDKLLASVEQLEEKYIQDNLEDIIDEFEKNRDTAAGLFHRLASLLSAGLRCLKPSMKLVLPLVLPLTVTAAVFFVDLFTDSRIQPLKHPDQGRYAGIEEDQIDRYLSLESKVLKKLESSSGERALVLLDGLHEELRYQKVDDGKLKKWLGDRNSLLAEEPYYTAIVATAEKYDIHPLLMFAIVGQEQAFVPKHRAAARKIANNPFNVFGSWEKYNTNIYDSSRLAADTIIKSSRRRPAYINIFKWINRRYAEDPNWWEGVSSLFTEMKKEIGS